jgi:hypothetical protein
VRPALDALEREGPCVGQPKTRRDRRRDQPHPEDRDRVAVPRSLLRRVARQVMCRLSGLSCHTRVVGLSDVSGVADVNLLRCANVLLLRANSHRKAGARPKPVKNGHPRSFSRATQMLSRTHAGEITNRSGTAAHALKHPVDGTGHDSEAHLPGCGGAQNRPIVEPALGGRRKQETMRHAMERHRRPSCPRLESVLESQSSWRILGKATYDGCAQRHDTLISLERLAHCCI